MCVKAAFKTFTRVAQTGAVLCFLIAVSGCSAEKRLDSMDRNIAQLNNSASGIQTEISNLTLALQNMMAMAMNMLFTPPAASPSPAALPTAEDVLRDLPHPPSAPTPGTAALPTTPGAARPPLGGTERPTVTTMGRPPAATPNPQLPPPPVSVPTTVPASVPATAPAPAPVPASVPEPAAPSAMAPSPSELAPLTSEDESYPESIQQ